MLARRNLPASRPPNLPAGRVTIQPTIETRWFAEGDLPAEVVDWYEEAVGLADWQERTDRYVRPVAADGLNVKWREGDIEIKRRVDVLGPMAWGPAVGVAERWRKWSFPLADDLPLGATGKDWVPVHKRRSTRTFEQHDDRLLLTKPGLQLPHGCRVELAEIDYRHQPWWTVCLEAFGPDAEAREMLQRTGERVFAETGAPALPREASRSYVAWLSAIV